MLTFCIKITAIIVLTHGLRILGKSVGPRWSGMILGLPASTAIVLFFYAHDQGVEFAVRSAEAALLGLVSAVSFALIVARLLAAGWGYPRALSAGIAGFMLVALAMSGLPEATGVRIPVVVGFLLATHLWAARLLVAPDDEPEGRRPLSWLKVMALRTAIPAGSLMAVLTVAGALGPTWAGLIGTFPCTLVAVLTVTYLESGPVASVQTARNFPLGNFSMIAFIAVFRFVAPEWGVAGAMAAGYASSFLTLGLIEFVCRCRCAAVRPKRVAPSTEPQFDRDPLTLAKSIQHWNEQLVSVWVPGSGR